MNIVHAHSPWDVNQRKLAKFFGVSLAELRGDNVPIAHEPQESAIEAHNDAHLAAARLMTAAGSILASVAREGLDAEVAVAALEAATEAMRLHLLNEAKSEE